MAIPPSITIVYRDISSSVDCVKPVIMDRWFPVPADPEPASAVGELRLRNVGLEPVVEGSNVSAKGVHNLIDGGELHRCRVQLGPHYESTTYNLFCRWFFL